MKMIDKFGSMAGGLIREAYEGVMRTFFAVPGISVSGDNLLANPQFDSGTTGWVNLYASHSVASNILTNIGNGGLLYAFEYQDTTVAAVAGHKTYSRVRIRVTNSASSNLVLASDNSVGTHSQVIATQTDPDINEWYTLSGIITLAAGITNNIRSYVRHGYDSAGIANGKVMQIDGTELNGVLVVDLTDIFGTGNEPDLDFCDAFYQDFFAYSGTNYHGQIRIKPDCPVDADTVNFRGKTTPWIIGDDITSGYDCGTINEHESSATYSEDDFVIYVGTIYRSLQNSNTGNIPISSPAYWVDVSDINNNEWYVCMSTGLRNYFRAFPGKNGVYNEDIYLPPDCVHGYYFEDNPYDSIGNEDGSDTDVKYVNAIEGEAGLFNGASSRIDCGSPTDFNRTVKSGGCAYEFWIYMNSWGSSSPPNRLFQDNNGWSAWAETYTAGKLRVRKYNGTTIFDMEATGLSLATWYHVVINQYSDYSRELFINSVSEDTDLDTTIPNNGGDGITIGAENPGGG